MPSPSSVFIETLTATAGTGNSWSVTVTKSNTVGTAAVIPLGGSTGGVSGVANSANVSSVSGQKITFDVTTTGTAQPSSLSVVVIYTN